MASRYYSEFYNSSPIQEVNIAPFVSQSGHEQDGGPILSPEELGQERSKKLNWSKLLWTTVFLLIFIPLVKSFFVVTYNVSKHITTNLRLQQVKAKLSKDKTVIVSKLNNYHSRSGKKRTIKEEIKALEQNEVLIRII